MTNLNKENRAATIESVIRGTFIPEEKLAIMAATTKAARDLVLRSLPEGFIPATANLPTAWFDSVTYLDVHKEQNPRCILDGKERWERHSTAVIKFDKVITPPHHTIYSLLGVNGKGDRESWREFWARSFAAQIDAATKLRDKEEKLRDELMAFLHSVKTYKQVIEKMPELERHLPAPPVKAFPIATSTAPLVKILGKMGFDRSAPVEAP